MKARLAPGVSVEAARAALATLSARNREAYPDAWQGRDFNILPSGKVAIHPLVDGPITAAAALLLTVVALVLLIACTNLASFLLARKSLLLTALTVRSSASAISSQDSPCQYFMVTTSRYSEGRVWSKAKTSCRASELSNALSG